MKETVRISFDVPADEHIFLKIECAKAHVALRDLMKEVFHKTVQELKHKKLHSMLLKGFEESYEGKTSKLSKKDLAIWNKFLDD